jgi:hypothetical protein
VSAQRARADIFSLGLEILDRERDRYLVRAWLRAPGVTAGVGTVLSKDELEDLLAQVERQYADLQSPVKWEGRASPSIRLSWRLDQRGHVAGRIELQDRAEGWATVVRIRGDQSYLPRVALGLRLLLR